MGRFPQRKKNQKRKENQPHGKAENAKGRVSRFPTGPATRDEETTTRESTKTHKEGGLSTAIIDD